MIDIKMTGDREVIARMSTLNERIMSRLSATMDTLGLDLLGDVQENLSGKVLKVQTGRLRGAQNLQANDSADKLTRQVGFNTSDVTYGAVHEFGGDHEFDIVAVRAKALRFVIGGKVIFRKSVHRQPLPERSFLRSALREIAPQAIAQIEAAVTEEAQH